MVSKHSTFVTFTIHEAFTVDSCPSASVKSALTSANRVNAKEGGDLVLEDDEEEDLDDDDGVDEVLEDGEDDDPPTISTSRSKNLSSISVQTTFEPFFRVPVETPLGSPELPPLPPLPLSVKYPSNAV
jgi:hypothetical protein